MLDRLMNPLNILYSLPGILIGLVVHEVCHAVAATVLGDNTPGNDGRLSFNPLHHLDPIGTIMIILLGFGWAKPVRINPANFKNPRKGMVYVSLAGPLSNLILAFIFSFLLTSLIQVAKVENQAILTIVYYAYYINIVLFAFNLIPIPPLDGFNVLSMFFKPDKIRWIWQLKKYGIMIIIALSIFGVLGLYLGFVFRGVDTAFEFIKSFFF